MGVTTGQLRPLETSIARFQPPASVQQFDAGNEAASIAVAVTPNEPGQRQTDADDQPSLDPQWNAGNKHGDPGQGVTDAAANQQNPGRVRFNPQGRQAAHRPSRP